MPPKPKVTECGKCGSVRSIRASSGFCYSCHWHYVALPNLKPKGTPVDDRDPDEIEEMALRAAVRRSVSRLFVAWTDDSVKGLERQELAAWDLIDRIEDLLGKE